MYLFFDEDKLEKQTYEDIQVDGISVHPRLFWLEHLNFSCAFTLFPPQANQISYLKILIEAAGGIVLTKLDAHTIPLVDDYFIECSGSKYSNTAVPEDHFSSKFINDSIVADKILDLNKYRCSQSKYENFDSNSILLRSVKWSELSLKMLGPISHNREAIASPSSVELKIEKTISPGRTRSRKLTTTTLPQPNISRKSKSIVVPEVTNSNLQVSEKQTESAKSANIVENDTPKLDDGLEISTNKSPASQTQTPISKFSPTKRAERLLRVMRNALDESRSSSDDGELQEHERRHVARKRLRSNISTFSTLTVSRHVTKLTGSLKRGLGTASQDISSNKFVDGDSGINTRRTRSSVYPTTVVAIKEGTKIIECGESNSNSKKTKSSTIYRDGSTTKKQRSLVDTKNTNTNGSIYDFDESSSSFSSSRLENQTEIETTKHISPCTSTRMMSQIYNSAALAAEVGSSTQIGKRNKQTTKATKSMDVRGVSTGDPAQYSAMTDIQSTQRRDISLPPSLKEAGTEIVVPMSPIHDTSDDDSNVDGVSARSRETYAEGRREYRRPYSTEDGLKILDVIITNEWYSNYMAVSIWREMESMKLFSIHRPWQGIKEHFLKKILPNLTHHKYRLTEENLQRFKGAKHRIRNSNRQPAPACVAPAFTIRKR